MQIARGATHVDLVVREAAQPVADRWHAPVEHRRIGNDHHVGRQLLFVTADVVVEVGAADLLLALEHDLDVDRQAARLLQVRFDGLEVHEDLALVVRGAARVDLAVADGGLEGRRFPQLERIDGLNVVVSVEEHRRRAGRAEPLAVDDGIAGRLFEPRRRQTDATELVARPLGAAANVGSVLRQGADAGDGQVFLQLVEIAVAVRVDEIDDGMHCVASVSSPPEGERARVRGRESPSPPTCRSAA